MKYTKDTEVLFSVSTGYVNSKNEETFTFEQLGIDHTKSEEEINTILDESHKDWLWDNIDTGWYIKEEE